MCKFCITDRVLSVGPINTSMYIILIHDNKCYFFGGIAFTPLNIVSGKIVRGCDYES